MIRQCRRLAHHGVRSAKSFICSRVVNTKLGVDNTYLDNLHRSIGKTDVHRQAHEEVESFLRWSRYRQFCVLFASSCKWINILAPSWQLASMDRCLLLLAKVYSTWALSAIFFGSTSVAPDQDPDCEPQEGFWPMLVQSVTVALIAGVFGALPLGCLVLVQQACQAQVSTARTTFRSFVFAYTFTCWLTTCLFLAAWSNINCFASGEASGGSRGTEVWVSGLGGLIGRRIMRVVILQTSAKSFEVMMGGLRIEFEPCGVMFHVA